MFINVYATHLQFRIIEKKKKTNKTNRVINEKASANVSY